MIAKLIVFVFAAADLNLLKVPSDLSDNKALFLSDILATAWFAVDLAKVADGDTVAIWGAGPGECCNIMPGCDSLCWFYVVYIRLVKFIG